MSRIERLTAEHDVADFCPGTDDLDEWLRNAAVTADRAGTARVYLWVDEPNDLVGYFALAPHTVRREEVPSSVGRGAPDVIPGFLLARLALSERRHGKGEGGELLAHALTTVLAAIRVGGGRVIIVDAIDERARGFYEHHGFRPVPGGQGRLVMKASTAAASLHIEWL